MKRTRQCGKVIRVTTQRDSSARKSTRWIPKVEVISGLESAAPECATAFDRVRLPIGRGFVLPGLSPKRPSCRGRDLPEMPLEDAIQIRSAEYWLKLGEPDQALRELEVLSGRSWRHPWAVRIRDAALRALSSACEFAI